MDADNQKTTTPVISGASAGSRSRNDRADGNDDDSNIKEADKRLCTSLPLCYDRSELFTLGSRPGMECMPLRSPPGPYHYHVTDQTKSLQELQNEVGALLEFRDLVIETFPDLKHKMASISASNTITGIPTSSLASRRDWEPGIRVRRKLTQKEHSTDIQPSSLIRSRSNSHSGKKEPKSGEGNGSVVQDSGFSTETNSSKETHSASSTTGGGGGTGVSGGGGGGAGGGAGGHHHHNHHHLLSGGSHPISTTAYLVHRMPNDAEDELWNLLDVIHRKSTRLRDEVGHLQGLDRDNRPIGSSSSNNSSTTNSAGNSIPTMFQAQLEQISKEDVQILRKERDRLLEKLFEMEAASLAHQIRANKQQDEVETLHIVKCDLEEQLAVALSQKRKLNCAINNLHQHRVPKNTEGSPEAKLRLHLPFNKLAPSTSVVDNATPASHVNYNQVSVAGVNTFSPVILKSEQDQNRFSTTTTTTTTKQLQNDFNLGRLDGLVSSPNRSSRVRVTDSKKIAAILLETNIVELQRHLLTITVQNQVLTQRLEQGTKSKIYLIKKLDKAKEDIDDLRFQLEEKTIDLEGTRAQLRIIETKSRHHLQQHRSEHNNTSERYNSPASRDSTTTTMNASQVSTPSMKAMTPLAMDELQPNHHNSSSTESTQDQNELEYSRQETPRRRPPSKIPLPGTKGYLAPKPPTGRTATSSSSTTSSITQRTNPSGPPSNRSLSKSTGSLFGRSGPNSVTKAMQSPSLHRPESAQSLRKDSSSLSNCSRSSSSIPISASTKVMASPMPRSTTTSHNSPLPKPKRESLTSRVRNMDSLTRIQNTVAATTPTNPSPTISYSSSLYKSTSKKDLSSSFSTGQTRDRKQTTVSVRRVSSASVSRASGIDISTSAVGETDNGKAQISTIKRIAEPDVLCKFSASATTTPTNRESAVSLTPPLLPSRDLIREYLARNSAPPAIFKPLFHPFSPSPQLEIAYKHPRLLLNDNNHTDSFSVRDSTALQSSIYTETNRESEIKYVDDNSIEMLDAAIDKQSFVSQSNTTVMPTKKRTAFYSIENDVPPARLPSNCKLIGKVNPNLVKTWEQLNMQQLYPVNHAVHASESSEDFFDSIDDQFISELERIPSMYANEDNDEDNSSSMVTTSGTVGVGMSQYESLDKRKLGWSLDSDKLLVT